ncbi:hypothetical protein, partial [Phenylobacterium sp.]|uniref:hypothetical protein n=1 Tax=Phenylobacterium sp. TaxID=1871053 RepID=UPI003BAAD2B3
MTASPINAPSALNAVAAPGAAQGLFGASQAAAAQGPLAGFDALLAAFFGGQGQAEPGVAATLGAAKTQDGTKIAVVGGADADAKEKDAADGAEALDTPALSTDAQVLAALLAQPIPLTPAPAAGEAAPVEA